MNQEAPSEHLLTSVLRSLPMIGRMMIAVTQMGAVERFAPLKRLVWRQTYNYLAKSYELPEWQVMNYGFTALPTAVPIALAAEDESERYGLQLYDRVAGAAPLTGLDVLEVGSGRGGGAAYVKRSLGPATLTGLDYSRDAIDLCQRRYSIPGLSFRHGDAERMPFPDDSFDAVLNVESSHCYGSLETFFREVRRVLKPGGAFLYADFRDVPEVDTWREQIRASGMTQLSEADISANVVAALEVDSQRRVDLVNNNAPKALQSTITDLVGPLGSIAYEKFRSGDWVYLTYVLRNDEVPATSAG